MTAISPISIHVHKIGKYTHQTLACDKLILTIGRKEALRIFDFPHHNRHWAGASGSRVLRTDRVVKFPFPSIDLPLALLAYHSDTIALIFHECLLRKALVQMLVNLRTLYILRAHGTLGSTVVLLPFDILFSSTSTTNSSSSGIVLTRPDAPHHLPRVDATGEFAHRVRQPVTAAPTRGWSRGVRGRVDDLPPSRRVVLEPRPRIHDYCARPALGCNAAAAAAAAAGSPWEAEACSTETKDVSIGIAAAGTLRRRRGWER